MNIRDLKTWKQTGILEYEFLIQERRRLATRLLEINDQINMYNSYLQQMEEDIKLQELIYFCNYGIYPYED